MYPKLRIGFAPAASHALTLITKILFLKLDCYPLESKSCYLYPMAFHGRSSEAQRFIAPMIRCNRENLYFPRRLPRGQAHHRRRGAYGAGRIISSSQGHTGDSPAATGTGANCARLLASDAD
jgi:hypothetical protein